MLVSNDQHFDKPRHRSLGASIARRGFLFLNEFSSEIGAQFLNCASRAVGHGHRVATATKTAEKTAETINGKNLTNVSPRGNIGRDF